MEEAKTPEAAIRDALWERENRASCYGIPVYPATMKAIDRFSFDWGIRAFGLAHMTDVPIRALRMVEEAIEVAQAAGIAEDLIHRQATITYQRSRGDLRKEIGGLINTARLLCTAMGVDPEEALIAEVRRVLASSPEHFAKRNEEKLSLGLDTAKS